MRTQSANGTIDRDEGCITQFTDYTPLRIWECGPYQFCTFFNRRWLPFAGQSSIGECHEAWNAELHPDDLARSLRTHQRAFIQRRTFRLEYRVRDCNGCCRWIRDEGTPSFGFDGQFAGYTGVCVDITREKELEQQLQSREQELHCNQEHYRAVVGGQTELICQTEARFRAIFDLNVVPLAYWHADGHITDANDAYLHLVGYSREDLRNGEIRWDRMTPMDDRHLDEEALKELESGRDNVTPFEKHYRRKDGRTVPILLGAALLPGFRDRGLTFAIDLSDQKRFESELREEKALNAAIISSLSGHVAVIDREGRIIAVNDSWVRFAATGAGATDKVDIGANYLEVCGKALRCCNKTTQEALTGIRAVLTGVRPEFTMQYQCESMAPQWFEMRVEQLRRPEGGAVISHIDVTNRVRAEMEAQNHRRELAHVARVTLLGELTASIAHELNQPLTAMLSNAQAGHKLLTKRKNPSTIILDILSDIAADGRRAGEVIRRLRSLLQKGESQKQPLDVNVLIEQTLPLVHSEMIIRRVSVEKHLQAKVPAVMGDRVQLEQVILNLVVNAAEAMTECPLPERKVVLSTFTAGGNVGIRVRDFGPGLDPKYRDQIFESFFTTKDHGMGLGLWINRAIIEAHSGELLAVNNDDKGCTFDVVLPAHNEDAPNGRPYL